MGFIGPGRRATGAALTRPKASTATPSITTSCDRHCSIRLARAAIADIEAPFLIGERTQILMSRYWRPRRTERYSSTASLPASPASWPLELRDIAMDGRVNRVLNWNAGSGVDMRRASACTLPRCNLASGPITARTKTALAGRELRPSWPQSRTRNRAAFQTDHLASTMLDDACRQQLLRAGFIPSVSIVRPMSPAPTSIWGSTRLASAESLTTSSSRDPRLNPDSYGAS